MRRTDKMHTFVKAYDKYRIIENDADLRKEKLTLCDYAIVGECLRTLSEIKGNAYLTICTSVANWFKRNGFSVSLDGNKINYVISL